MIRIAVAAVLALGISLLVRPAQAVIIDTDITSNGEPVGGATIRLETLDGDPIKLTAVREPPKDEGKSATPAETAPPSVVSPVQGSGTAPGMPDDKKQETEKNKTLTATDEPKSKTADPPGDGSDKADTMAALLTDKDGKLSALLDDSFKNKTVLVVVEKDGHVLMKKSVELSKDVTRVAIGVPPERLAMLPKPNAGPPGGAEPKQETPAPPPAGSSVALVPERPVGPPELAVAIGREGECRPGGDCCYRMTVTNAGAGPWRGPIGLSDEMSFAPAALDIERSRPSWWCSQAGQTATCASAPLTLAKGQSAVLQQCLLLPRRMSSAVRKCVRIIWPGAGGPDADRDRTRLVQIALSQRGHDPGIADGLMGRKTERSIGEFRKANALAPDGGIDPSLLAALLGD
ncbi:MAG: peptidoglycan-binding domain-containing protein, partial [Xanthobacteraceae bacterium]